MSVNFKFYLYFFFLKYIFQSHTTILFTIMLTATCFDSKESSSGYP